jgi:hypothetical protein
MNRTIMVIIGWLVACCAFLLAISLVDFCWNWSTWSLQELHLEDYVFLVLLFFALLIVFWFLARVTHGRISLVVAIIACLVLVAFGIIGLHPEPIIHGRIQPSPLWYRGSRLLLMCLPILFCLWWRRRHSSQQALNRTGNPQVTREGSPNG